MSLRIFGFLGVVTLIAIAGCAPGTGAESHLSSGGAGIEGTPHPAEPRTASSQRTPNFGPPAVTAPEATAAAIATVTGQASDAPVSSSSNNTTYLAPNPPTVEDPAAPIPADAGLTAVYNSPNPTPEPQPVPIDRAGTFRPSFNYDYQHTDAWELIVGAHGMMLLHEDKQARISLRERHVDRSSVDSISQLAVQTEPLEFVDWSERSFSDLVMPDEYTASFSYRGTRVGEPYVAIVRWFLWGELLLEVVVEAEAQYWAGSTLIRNTSLLLADSFAPPLSQTLNTTAEVEAKLKERFSSRRSGVYVQSANGRTRTELSCRQVFNEFLSEPVFVGSGVWQAFAVGNATAQVWEIFEPNLTVFPAVHNTSSC